MNYYGLSEIDLMSSAQLSMLEGLLFAGWLRGPAPGCSPITLMRVELWLRVVGRAY